MSDACAETKATKAALRRKLRQRATSLDPDQARQAAERLADRLLCLPEVERARCIFTCLSFGAEIDTWTLVERLLASGTKIYVSRTDLAANRLHIHPYPCQLETLASGLQQPTPSQPELPAEAIDDTLDVALIVGIGFDRRGFRLGYGRGFFDRFLANRPFPAIGLAYDFQLLDALPAESHDVPMSAVVTEARVVRPSVAADPR